jgi:hypothetical protein
MSSPLPSVPETETEKEPSFPLFLKSLSELRLKIWKLNMAEPRVLKISHTPRNVSATEIVTYSAKEVKSSCTTPPNLHVNQESRAEGLKLYTPIFSTHLPYYVYFNSKDYLWFDGDYWRNCFKHFVGSSNPTEEDNDELQLIQNKLKNSVISGGVLAVANSIDGLAKIAGLEVLVLPSYYTDRGKVMLQTFLKDR